MRTDNYEERATSRHADESLTSAVPHGPYTLFVRVRLSNPDLPLVPALTEAPQMRVRPRSTIPGTDRVFVAGVGDDLLTFENAIVDDPTVSHPSLISALADRRIYRIDLTERGRAKLSPLHAAEAYVRDASGTRDGWTVRMEVSDRDALVRFARECRNVDVDLDVQRITEIDGVDDRNDYGLSPEQERILRAAYEDGYFDVPRNVSQTDLAESFDLSTSAVSQHLRRATAELVENTLFPRRDS